MGLWGPRLSQNPPKIHFFENFELFKEDIAIFSPIAEVKVPYLIII